MVSAYVVLTDCWEEFVLLVELLVQPTSEHNLGLVELIQVT